MLDEYIQRQVETALAQLPPPPPGYHYAVSVGNIVFNMNENAWRYDLRFRLVGDDQKIIEQLQ